MNLLEALIIGAIQGVAEWLPISSEAVITLAMTQLIGTDPTQALNASIFLHSGTMLAAFIYFRKEYMSILNYILGELNTGDFLGRPGKLLEEKEGSLTVFLLVSTIFTGLIGGPLYFLGLEKAVESQRIFYGLMAAALFLTGLMRLYKSTESRKKFTVNLKDSIFVGILQGFSIIPGISRSGVTSFGFLFHDFDARSAFHLSFLMSVPAIFAANVVLGLTDFVFRPIYLVSSGVAAIVGYLTIEAVLEIADRAEIAWICFGLGILALLPIFL